MTITAKELAKILNLSEASISMALNGKPGVSTKTKHLIIDTAHKYGYDFTKVHKGKNRANTISFIIYRKTGAVVSDTDFFNTLSDSIAESSKLLGYKLAIHYIIEGNDVTAQIDYIITPDTLGIILLGTEMKSEDFFPFAVINLPIVVLDTYFNSMKMDCVQINNTIGAYQATNLLIKERRTQPGYLKSSYSIFNFEERADGFYKAIRDNGFSASNSVVHLLSPQVNGAYADMKQIIAMNEPLAECYFADNDIIAVGAIKALKEAGYRLPEDISIIGFDNLPLCSFVEPNLSTVNVPIKYMGAMAVERLINVTQTEQYSSITLKINTNIVKRKSV